MRAETLNVAGTAQVVLWGTQAANTPTWQFSIRPAVPVYMRSTSAETPDPAVPRAAAKEPATPYLLSGQADMPRTTNTRLTRKKVKSKLAAGWAGLGLAGEFSEVAPHQLGDLKDVVRIVEIEVAAWQGSQVEAAGRMRCPLLGLSDSRPRIAPAD